MNNRRRQRYRKHQKRNKANLNFTPVIVMLCLSIGCGYAAAKYVVDPVVNYVPQLTSEKKQADEISNTETPSAVDEKVSNKEEEGKIAGYALQFGCYSGQAAAESIIPSIGVDGLQVIKQDDMYKIVGEVYKTKDEAKNALADLPPITKAFVTPIYE